MPLERHRTIVVLVALMFGLFFLEDIFGVPASVHWKTIPVTVHATTVDLLHGEFSLDAAGHLASVLTAVFLHGDIGHVLFNMVYLWAFASLASQHLGQWWAFGLFFVLGICGNIAHIALNSDSPIGLLGASGAVSGFEGVYLGLALRWSLRWPDVWPLAHPIPPAQLCLFAGVGFVIDVFGLVGGSGGVAFAAHIGGFLSGVAIAWLITLRYRTEESWRRRC